MKDKNGWIKLPDNITLTGLIKLNLGCFLGRYEEVFQGYNTEYKNILYYVSHFNEDDGSLHIRQYPTLLPCAEVNHFYFKLTHYMLIHEPKDEKLEEWSLCHLF
jgi:hypothetical protein